MLTKEIFGLVALGCGALAYVFYISSVLSGKTRPHMFSWIVWAITDSTIFAAQFTRGAGPGAWVTAFTATISVVVAMLSVKRGEKHITRGDWLSLMTALTGILLWYATDNPAGTIILNIAIDVAACYPTVRKSYGKPWEENATFYALAALRSVLSLFAMEKFSFITTASPFSVILMNGFITLLLLHRRKMLKTDE
jgi:hypothetical protein